MLLAGDTAPGASSWTLALTPPPANVALSAAPSAPNTKRGAQQADTELAKLVAEVTTGRTTPTSGITVRQLVERYVHARSSGWAPGQAHAVRQRAENHTYPHLGDMPLERLRAADIERLHATPQGQAHQGRARSRRVHDRARARDPAGRVGVGRGSRADPSEPRETPKAEGPVPRDQAARASRRRPPPRGRQRRARRVPPPGRIDGGASRPALRAPVG